MNDKIDRLRLAAEDTAGGPASAEQVDALIALVDALEAELAARQPTEDGEYMLKIIESIRESRSSVEIAGVKIMPCDEYGRTAAVPDAATEELANAKAGWDSALRIVNESNDIIKKLGAERDAALAAIERVTAERDSAMARIAKAWELHEPFTWSFGYGPVQTCKWCADHGVPQDVASWPCPTIQALDGAPELEVKP